MKGEEMTTMKVVRSVEKLAYVFVQMNLNPQEKLFSLVLDLEANSKVAIQLIPMFNSI